MSKIENEITIDLREILPLDRDFAYSIALELNSLILQEYKHLEEFKHRPDAVCRRTAEIARLKFMVEHLVPENSNKRDLATKAWGFLAAEGYSALARNGFRVPESAPLVAKEGGAS